MNDEVVLCRFVRFVAMEEQEDVLFGEPVVTDTEVFAQAERVLKTGDGSFGSGGFDLITSRDDSDIRMLVFEAEDIGVVHAIEGRRVECIF